MVKKTKKSQKMRVISKSPRAAENKTRWPLFLIGSVVVLLVGTLIIGAHWFYRDRALPQVQIADVSVAHKTKEEVRGVIQRLQSELQVALIDNQQQKIVSAETLGVIVDSEATLEQIMQVRSPALWRTHAVSLVLRSDPGKLIEYIKLHYPSLFVDPRDAELVYNATSHQFDIKQGVPGKGFDIKWFQSQLNELAKQPRTIKLSLTTIPVEPIITDKALHEPQKIVNEHLQTPLTFTLKGATTYTATPDDIAAWVHVVPDAVNGTVAIEYDRAKIEQFLAQHIAPKVVQTPIDRKVLVNKETGAQTVVVPGRAGQQISDIGTIAGKIINALDNGHSLSQELTITTAPYKTVTLTSSGNWIEIDLSQQRLTMYSGETAINSFLISSGTAKTPTPTGVFRVWHKTPSQTMTGTFAGDRFYLPNVKWVSYINGDVAIHGTYWHNNFGRPMSHGCINMSEAAAKTVYDFAPLGTKIVIHQ